MRKLLIYLLGAGVVFGAAYKYVTSVEGRDRVTEVEEEGERMLYNVRKAAGRIEEESDQRVDKIFEESR